MLGSFQPPRQDRFSQNGRLTAILSGRIILPNWEEVQRMRLIGRGKLACAESIGIEIQKWMLSWVAEVKNAHWKHANDVSDQFPNVRLNADSSFLFPVGQCGIAIQVLIAFPQGIAFIQELKSSEDTNEH